VTSKMSSPSIHLQPKSSSSSGSLTPRSSSESTGSSLSFDIVRCSRCQRSLSIENASSPAPGVVQFGMNSYYCSRCASMVGFNRWSHKGELVLACWMCRTCTVTWWTAFDASFDSLHTWFYSTCHGNQSRITICSLDQVQETWENLILRRVGIGLGTPLETPRGRLVPSLKATSISLSSHNGNEMRQGGLRLGQNDRSVMGLWLALYSARKFYPASFLFDTILSGGIAANPDLYLLLEALASHDAMWLRLSSACLENEDWSLAMEVDSKLGFKKVGLGLWSIGTFPSTLISCWARTQRAGGSLFFIPLSRLYHSMFVPFWNSEETSMIHSAHLSA